MVLVEKVLIDVRNNMVYRRARIYKLVGIILLINVALCVLVFFFVENSKSGTQRSLRRNLSEIDLDMRPEPSNDLLVELINKEMPSLALEQLLDYAAKKYALNDSCAPYPNFDEIEFHNDYWQVARSDNITYYMFGAYYDKRETVKEAPLVRVLAMINVIDEKYPQMFCQLWFDDRPVPLIVPAQYYKLIWYAVWGHSPRHYYATLFGCKLPEGNDKYKVPQTVSVVSQECDKAINNLRVHYEQPASVPQVKPKKRFAVCVKALDFPYVDMSARIIEWLELMRELGAEKVTIYESQMHPNMTRVLRHYAATSDFLDLRGYAMGRGEPHTARHFQHFMMAVDKLNRIINEVITYNDCFYRHLYQYDVIAVCDIDEVIMPLGNYTNWSQLTEAVHRLPDACDNYVSYCFRNVYFPRYAEKPPLYTNLPSYFYMLQHVERVAEHLNADEAIKCLHTTQHAVILHNHFALSWTNSCGPIDVPTHMGQMQHYREPDDNETLLNPVVDDNIWRFRDPLVKRTTAMLKELGFIH